MSVYLKQAVVASFPAYDIVQREADSSGFVNIVDGDLLGLDSGKGFFRQYKPGSVVSYALQYNECPIEAVERAKAKGHPLRWINACATVISDSPMPRDVLVKVTIGMRVRFQGLEATIEKEHNNNLRFAPLQ